MRIEKKREKFSMADESREDIVEWPDKFNYQMTFQG